jgi:hypothetical protein
MSLIHWWPLNGDLQDKIQGKIFNNGGWTSASSGKIGTTYNANIGAVLSASLSIPNTFSFACWVKNNDLTYPQAPLPMKFSNGAPYSTASTSNKGWEFSHGNNSKLTLNNGSTAQELNFGTPHASYLGSWYHLVFTVDCHLKKASLFINGELKGEKSFTVTDFSGTYTFSLGQIHGWKLDGFVNDIRIYDHALSQAEVKELSKALVVHYTFDDILIEPTTNIDPCKDSLTTQNFPSTSFGDISRTYGNFYGFDCVEMYLNTTYSSSVWLYMNSNPITQGAKVGDTVTRSCWMYIPSGQTKPPHFTESIEGNSSGKTFVQYDFNKCDT